MSKPPSPDNARANFNTFLRDFPNFSIRRTQHARERMRERGIDLLQVRTVLARGSVQMVEPDIRTGNDKYRVAGRDADGRTLEVVVDLDETGEGQVALITVMESEGSSRSARQRRRRYSGGEPSGAGKKG